MTNAVAIKTTSIPQVEPLHPDVIAFCKLIARIYHRVLSEQDAQVIAMITAPVAESDVCIMAESEVAREAA